MPYERGGLQVPVSNGCPTNISGPLLLAWVATEHSVSDFPLNTFPLKKNMNPFLKNTIITWHAAHERVGDPPELSQVTPMGGNERFTPGKNDGGFKIWNIKGIQSIKDLYAHAVLLTFDQLCTKYLIPPKQKKQN